MGTLRVAGGTTLFSGTYFHNQPCSQGAESVPMVLRPCAGVSGHYVISMFSRSWEDTEHDSVLTL